MLFTLALIAAISLPPKPTAYVTDRAGVLPNRVALNEKLAGFERQTSDQILVYVDQRLPPETTIEEMSAEAVHQWGVGQKGKDNGAVLFVFVADRKMRIEVGYGLEGVLTDAKARQITSTIIKPAFQRGDYAAGIEQGVDAMLAAVKGEPYKGSGRTDAQMTVGWWTKPAAGCVFFAIFALVFAAVPIIIIVLAVRAAKRGGGQGSTRSTGGSWSSGSSSSESSSWSSSDSSSSDSGSSFSGGGGDSGGGGASDSW